MKTILLGAVIMLLAFVANAQPPAGDAKPGEWYGEKTTPEGAVLLSDAAKNLGESEVVNTKIKAKVLEVCPKKGCWLKVQVNDSTTATVKMKDYGFFLPVAAKGKTVVIDGEMKTKMVSVAELQHYAEDAKKSKEEIAAIIKPEREVRIMAKGIVIVE